MKIKTMATTAILVAGLSWNTVAYAAENYKFATCDGATHYLSDKHTNTSVVSEVFHTTETNDFTILISFRKHYEANYPDFTSSGTCYVWDYKTEREAKDSRNDKIASAKSNDFNVVTTLWSY